MNRDEIKLKAIEKIKTLRSIYNSIGYDVMIMIRFNRKEKNINIDELPNDDSKNSILIWLYSAYESIGFDLIIQYVKQDINI